MWIWRQSGTWDARGPVGDIGLVRHFCESSWLWKACLQQVCAASAQLKTWKVIVVQLFAADESRLALDFEQAIEVFQHL